MILFACDWCEAVKERGQRWILGMGLEQVALTAARREIDILADWDDARAVHPLAVHFCCAEHKDNYIAALFHNPAPATMEVVIETEVESRPIRTEIVRSTETGSKAKKDCDAEIALLTTPRRLTPARPSPSASAPHSSVKPR